YSNSSYPSHSDANLLTITYYDCYNFLLYTNWDNEAKTYWATSDNGAVDLSKIFNIPSTSIPFMPYNPVVRGYVTGTKVKYGSIWLNAVTYYDKNYNAVQTISENHLGGKDITTTKIDIVSNRILL